MEKPSEFYEVSIANISHYNNPPICVACGAPAGASIHNVGASKKSGRVNQSINFAFPLCVDCGAAQGDYDRIEKRLFYIAAPLTLLVAGIIFCNFNRFKNETLGYLLCGSILAGVLLFFGLRWLLGRLLLSKASWDRHNRIERSAKIKSFGAYGTTLLFRNHEFGRLFDEANKNPDPAEIERLMHKRSDGLGYD
jgi:hypothetical protein